MKFEDFEADAMGMTEDIYNMSIPQRNLYQLRKYFFKHLQLRIRDIVKQQILVSDRVSSFDDVGTAFLQEEYELADAG